MSNFLLCAGGAVMGPMKESFHAIQNDTKICAMMRLHLCTQMRQERFDFTPMDVAAYRAIENGMQQIPVLVAHGLTPAVIHIIQAYGIGCAKANTMGMRSERLLIEQRYGSKA
jgi:hypothetical protein